MSSNVTVNEGAIMNTLAVTPEVRLARPLKALVPLIKSDLNDAREAGLEYYRAAGEKLQEAKSQVGRGEWGGWLRDNFELSQSTALTYMNLAGEVEFTKAFENVGNTNSPPAENFRPRRTLSDFREPGRGSHQPQWHAPVQEILRDRLDVPRLRQEAQDREKEDKLQRQLGLQLIDIGYKVLATKLHPDKGGSQEAMIRLQQVRDRLKGAI